MVSDTGTNYGLDPRIAPGFGGKLYLSWHQQGWGVYFRERSAGGAWGPITTLRSASTWSAETGVAEDGQGRPHVVFLEENASKVRTLVHRHRDGGTWSRTVLSTGTEESVPCIDTDSSGRVHLVYAKGGDNAHYLYHRIWTEGTWGLDTAIGNTAIPSGWAGYERPNIQAKGSIVHLSWIEPGGDRFRVRYKRFNGTSWSAAKTVGQSVSQSWMSNCRLAVADDNTIVIAWARNGLGFSAFSTDGGNTWSAEQQVSAADLQPSNMYGRGGKAYLIAVQPLNSSSVMLYAWADGSWNAGERVNPGEVNFDAWGDVTQAVDGAIHVVYYHAVNSGNTSGGVDYVMQPTSSATGTVSGRVVDAVGPVPDATITSSLGGETVSDFDGTFTMTCPAGTGAIVVSMLGYNKTEIGDVTVTAGRNTVLGDVSISGIPPMVPNTDVILTPGNTQIGFAWQNSPSVNYSGTLIVYSRDGYPAGPTDGALLVDLAGYPGESSSFTHAGLTNGVPVYYAIFAHDNHPIRTYAAAVIGVSTPALKVDHDSDGDVDQADFGWFQACLSGAYVPQSAPDCLNAMLDGDSDVDGDDLAIFADCLSGSGNMASPNCLP